MHCLCKCRHDNVLLETAEIVKEEVVDAYAYEESSPTFERAKLLGFCAFNCSVIMGICSSSDEMKEEILVGIREMLKSVGS